MCVLHGVCVYVCVFVLHGVYVMAVECCVCVCVLHDVCYACGVCVSVCFTWCVCCNVVCSGCVSPRVCVMYLWVHFLLSPSHNLSIFSSVCYSVRILHPLAYI